jgi:sigma-E factor negative regulatory protein RseC
MLKEQARIVAIDNEAIWVETIELSTCGSCSAKKGCGQSLLASMGAKPTYLRVLLPAGDTNDYLLDQSITIGLPENIVVNTSLLLYLLPLCLMLATSGFAHSYFASESLTIAMAVVGLFLGGMGIRFYSYKYQYDSRFQPVIVNREEVSIFNENALRA